MRNFRKISVDGVEYKWLFRFNDYDYIFYPYLLIVACANPQAVWRVKFPIKEHFMLNNGFSAVFQGKAVSINLNQPAYTAQIIRQCKKDGAQLESKGETRLNGVEILKKIGYEFDEMLEL